MAAPATEVATIPIKAGATIEDPHSSAGKIWVATLDTVSQQKGYQRAYYGRELEDPSLLQLFVDWDSYEAHQNFVNSSTYGPFVKHLMTIVDGDIDMRHANFHPHPPSNAVGSTSAPVTEVLTAYLSEKNEDYAANSRKFGEMIKTKADSCKGVSSGWIVEKVTHSSLGDGEKGNAYINVIGWESKEKHMQFRETQDFKDNIHLLRTNAKGLEVHHTAFIER